MADILTLLGFLVVALCGFFAGRWHGMSSRSKELSQSLQEKENELSDLKQNVNEHFGETAQLFSNLTEEYKALYKHLANGATKLSNQEFQLKIGAPASESSLTVDSTADEIDEDEKDKQTSEEVKTSEDSNKQSISDSDIAISEKDDIGLEKKDSEKLNPEKINSSTSVKKEEPKKNTKEKTKSSEQDEENLVTPVDYVRPDIKSKP